MNGEAGTVFTITMACLALETIMKDQIEQLNTIGVAATAMGINYEAEKNRKVQDCIYVKICKYGL